MFKKVDFQMEARTGVTIALLLVGCAQPQLENKPSTPQVEAPQTVSPRPASQQWQTPRRLKLRLTLDQPEDLKVTVNEVVGKSQLLSERSTIRASLFQQRNATKKRLQQLQGQKFAPSYAVEKAEVAQAEFKLEQAKTAISNFYSDSPWTDYARQVLPIQDGSRLRELEGKYQEARGELEIARANFLRVMHQPGFDFTEYVDLVEKLKTIDHQLRQRGLIRSPYAGRIKSIKWLGLVDQDLQVELTLMVKAGP